MKILFGELNAMKFSDILKTDWCLDFLFLSMESREKIEIWKENKCNASSNNDWNRKKKVWSWCDTSERLERKMKNIAWWKWLSAYKFLAAALLSRLDSNTTEKQSSKVTQITNLKYCGYYA